MRSCVDSLRRVDYYILTAQDARNSQTHQLEGMHWPALVAVQHDPHLRAFYQHLLAKGKYKMQALVAVMRKILHALHAMLKTHQPYDGSKLFRLKSAPAQEVTYVLVAC